MLQHAKLKLQKSYIEKNFFKKLEKKEIETSYKKN